MACDVSPVAMFSLGAGISWSLIHKLKGCLRKICQHLSFHNSSEINPDMSSWEESSVMTYLWHFTCPHQIHVFSTRKLDKITNEKQYFSKTFCALTSHALFQILCPSITRGKYPPCVLFKYFICMYLMISLYKYSIEKS